MRTELSVILCWVQGLYFLVTGVWPLVSIETFQLVTGRKTDHLVTGSESDHWLVNTVGVLVISIGATLVIAAYRDRFSPEIVFLGVTAALGLIGIDLFYVARGTIPEVYLVDAVLEVTIVTAWLVCAWRHSRAGK